MLQDKTYGLWIGGKEVPALAGKTFETRNPATGEVIARCAEAGPEDVDRAVEAAKAAFPVWSKKSPAERAEVLLKIADAIDARADELARIETMDNGKPIRETKGIDVPSSARRAPEK